MKNNLHAVVPPPGLGNAAPADRRASVQSTAVSGDLGRDTLQLAGCSRGKDRQIAGIRASWTVGGADGFRRPDFELANYPLLL